MTRLSVNLNKIALLRNQRNVGYPSVVAMAKVAIKAGANGISVHPRPDQRHITREDVFELASFYTKEQRTHHNIEYNIEGYPDDVWLENVLEVMPDQATLVPDAPEARTSDSGWNLDSSSQILKSSIRKLADKGIRVSVFMGHDVKNFMPLYDWGAQRIELYTGPYAHEFTQGNNIIDHFKTAADNAQRVGLGLNAGHDLSLDNLPTFVNGIDGLREVSIGHAWTADCLMLGMEKATKAYLEILQGDTNKNS